VQERVLCVLKVLQQLPEGLAIAILAASPVGLEPQLSVLPDSLHPLAIEAAFPSIRRHHSLTLDFASLSNPNTACTVLHAATAETSGASALQTLELKHIPVTCDDRLQQLISAACGAASDVLLDFSLINPEQMPESLLTMNIDQSTSHNNSLRQLSEALLHNSALTSLQLNFAGDPWRAFDFAGLIESLTGLQSLTLSSSLHLAPDDPPELPGLLRTPRAIAKLPCLTHLCFGPASTSVSFHGFFPPRIASKSFDCRVTNARLSILRAWARSQHCAPSSCFVFATSSGCLPWPL
jgi:hypothetical protein